MNLYKANWTGKRPANREPLRTVAEFAEEFGISVVQLSAYLSTEGAPKRELQSGSSSAGRKTYYKPSEMRPWWANKKKELDAK